MNLRVLVLLFALGAASIAYLRKTKPPPGPCLFRRHDAQDLSISQIDQSRSSATTHVYAFNPCWNLRDWTWHLVEPLSTPGDNPGPEVDLTHENGITYATVKGWARARKPFTATVHVELFDANHVELCHVDFPLDDNRDADNTEVPSKDNNQEYVRVRFPEQCGNDLFSRYKFVRLWVSWDYYKKKK